jgi:hypothetical protein
MQFPVIKKNWKFQIKNETFTPELLAQENNYTKTHGYLLN